MWWLIVLFIIFLGWVAILYIECLSDYSSFSNSFLDFNISINNMPLIFYAHIAYISLLHHRDWHLHATVLFLEYFSKMPWLLTWCTSWPVVNAFINPQEIPDTSWCFFPRMTTHAFVFHNVRKSWTLNTFQNLFSHYIKTTCNSEMIGKLNGRRFFFVDKRNRKLGVCCVTLIRLIRWTHGYNTFNLPPLSESSQNLYTAVVFMVNQSINPYRKEHFYFL